MLFNEPKLLKSTAADATRALDDVSVLFNEPKLLKSWRSSSSSLSSSRRFSALQRAEIAEMLDAAHGLRFPLPVSVLFNEPKLLKSSLSRSSRKRFIGFSALQRAEIAEIGMDINEIFQLLGFSALQRAEIAEIAAAASPRSRRQSVSVLFNEPKLLKFNRQFRDFSRDFAFQCSSTSRNC